MDRFLRIGFLGLLMLCTGALAWADHPSVGFGSGLAGPITTIPATALPEGRGSLGIRAEYLRLRPFSDAELERLAGEGVEVHSTKDLLSTFLSAAYGLTDRLTLAVHLPYVRRRGIREGHPEEGAPEVHARGDVQGFGDLTLLGQYRWTGEERARFHAALLLGLKLPVERTRARDPQGERLEAEHQPDSGSWDPLLGLP